MCNFFRLRQSPAAESESVDSNSTAAKWQVTGQTIQIVLFILNGSVWVISILAIIGGFIVGLNTKTINIRLELLDLTVTTPATIFITYGFIIILAAILGCFTATGGNIVITIGYIIMLIVVLIFDGGAGVSAFFSTTSLLGYMESLRHSMNDYGKEDSDGVGIFQTDPTVYWDHLQSKGQCCGFEGFGDWKNTSLGKEKDSVPDTCCNAEYDYTTCGSAIFRHPDDERHEMQDIVYTRGCMKIFPTPLVNSFQDTVYVGILLGAVLLFCLVLAISLLFLVVTGKYTTGGGPDWQSGQNTRRINDPEDRYRSREYRMSDTKSRRRDLRKVGPAGGDQSQYNGRDNLFGERDQTRKKVLFQDQTLFMKHPKPKELKTNEAHEATVLYTPQSERRRYSD